MPSLKISLIGSTPYFVSYMFNTPCQSIRMISIKVSCSCNINYKMSEVKKYCYLQIVKSTLDTSTNSHNPYSLQS